MNTIFGVSSTTASNTKLKNGYTLFDWVMRQKGIPAFWFRTISGEGAVTQEEINYLKENDCKPAFMIKNLTSEQLASSDGTDDGIKIAEIAKNLGIPQNKNIALIVEIRADQNVSHSWMCSFAEAIVSEGYIPGFIGNTDSSVNFNFDRQCSRYVQATGNTDYYHAVYGATEPKYIGEPEEWTPYCPSALQPEDIQLWVTETIEFDNIKCDVIYAHDMSVLNNMWGDDEI